MFKLYMSSCSAKVYLLVCTIKVEKKKRFFLLSLTLLSPYQSVSRSLVSSINSPGDQQLLRFFFFEKKAINNCLKQMGIRTDASAGAVHGLGSTALA